MMNRRITAVVTAAVMAAALGCGLASQSQAAVVRHTSSARFATAPGVPSGYTLKYSHDFAHNAGFADWVVQPGAGATVKSSTASGAQFGMGVEMTAVNQWAELISSNVVITPDTYVTELVYAPAASGTSGNGSTFPAGSTANWPAWWTFGSPWPQNGEIDILEGQHGASCEQTHYGTSGEINSPSHCSQGNGTGTGWTTLTMWRTGEQVQVWYGGTFVGTVPLPTTANEKLVFQNQSYSSGTCANCFGPTLLGAGSTAWLSNVKVYSK